MVPPSLLIQAGKGEMETRAPLRVSLNLVQFAIAQQWAADQEISSESIGQLQETLGIPQTGIYDDLTIEAVYDQQVRSNEGWSGEGRSNENGIADKAFFQRHGLILTKKITKAKVTPEFRQQFLNEDGSPRSAFTSGISIACYIDYRNCQRPNIKPFAEAATIWANENKAIGMNDRGELQIGAPLKITETRELIELMQSISQGLKEMFSSTIVGEDENGEGLQVNPAWIEVKTLSLFARGTSFGLCTDRSGRFSEGLLSDQPDDEVYDEKGANLGSFVENLRGVLASNVHVHLFAGNTATDFDGDGHLESAGEDPSICFLDEEWKERGSYTSFAAWLQLELGEEATVFGQLTDWNPVDLEPRARSRGIDGNDQPNDNNTTRAFGKFAEAYGMK